MFKVKSKLTNTRPPASTVAELITSPTQGNIKISNEACKALDITNGDYAVLYEVELGDGSEAIVVAKGSSKEENGDANVGSKVAGTNGKATGTMQFSSSNTYNMLGGNKEENIHWDMDTENPIENDGATYFVITRGEATPKMKRGSAEEVVEEA